MFMKPDRRDTRKLSVIALAWAISAEAFHSPFLSMSPLIFIFALMSF